MPGFHCTVPARSTLHQDDGAVRITRWDFEEMGLRLGGYGWDAIKIWPALPTNEFDFWLYVAHAASEHKIPIPDFMASITDFGLIEDRLKKWRRAQEIEKWEQSLIRFPLEDGSAAGIVRGETDLRLVVHETSARLQWLRPGHEQFEDVKPAHLHEISDAENRGWIQFKTEAALLWQFLASRLFFTADTPSPVPAQNGSDRTITEDERDRLCHAIERVDKTVESALTWVGVAKDLEAAKAYDLGR